MIRKLLQPVVISSLLTTPLAAPGQEPARVRLEVQPGPHFVGQGIRLEVAVTATGLTRPTVEPPEAEGLKIVQVDIRSAPVSTSAIGSVVNQRVRYGFRYLVVTSRAGTVRLPPFRVRSDAEPLGRTAPMTLQVRRPPDPPPAFLGGVGLVEAASEVVPDAVRVGQPAEYRITLSGPGALGSSRPPDLARLRELAISPEVTRIAEETDWAASRRVLRYRVTPRRPGEVVLPPVLVEWFDPTRAAYQVTIVPALRFVARSAPPLDPSMLEFADAPPEKVAAPSLRVDRAVSRPSRGLDPRAWMVGWLGVVVLMLRARSRRLRRKLDPESVLRSVARGAPDSDRLETYLGALSSHLAPGVSGELTPDEAERAVARRTGDQALAGRIRALIEDADTARFSAAGRLPDGWWREAAWRTTALLERSIPDDGQASDSPERAVL